MVRPGLLFPLIGLFWIPALVAQNTNVTFRSKRTFTNQKLANIWGYTAGGYEYALVGAQEGLIIVDITDPDNPVQIVQIPGPSSQWREVKTYSHYAYVVSEGGGSIQVVDLANLPNSNLSYHSVDGGVNLQTAHALHVDLVKGYLYIYGSNLNGGRTQVFNLNGNAYTPAYAGFVNLIGYVHDGYANNDMLYSAHIYAGQFAVINMSNKASPVLLATQPTPGAFTHNTWLSGNTLFTTDEVINGLLVSYNVADPNNITQLDKIQVTPGSGSIVHNAHILNDYAVTSWYKDGFAIVDVARPDNMVVIGRYDTYPGGGGSGFEGCWGVYPYFPSGTIVASNIRAQGTNDGELWVFSPAYIRGCYVEGLVSDANTGKPLSGAQVQLLSTLTSETTNSVGVYKMGQLQSGTFTAQVSKPGYYTQSQPVVLTNGVVANLNVALVPVGSLPVELLQFEVRREGSGALLRWETAGEAGNAGFEVQHSAGNGQSWQALAFVPAQSGATGLRTYEYRTQELAPGDHFFRLRQIDRDGASAFSPWRILTITGKTLRATLSPNPASDHCLLRVEARRGETLRVEIRNLANPAYGMTARAGPDGIAELPLSLAQLPAGVYAVRVSDGLEQTVLLLTKIE